MNYIAHGDGEREQSILEHLQGTAEKQKILQKFLKKEIGDIAVECCMISENIAINFNVGFVEKK